MLGKGSKWYSIFALKCPRCHEGEMFETGSWSFKRSLDMEQKCTKCGLNYFPEPGYYFGAMFISYIWTAFFSLGLVFFCNWYLELSLELSFLILISLVTVNFVYIFRISRAMWININVAFDKDAVSRFEAAKKSAQN
jgi:uncharacterized protein (DUF983 family)